MAKIVRAISDMGGVVITVIDSTDIVKRMEEEARLAVLSCHHLFHLG